MDHRKDLIKPISLFQTKSFRLASYITAASAAFGIALLASKHTCLHSYFSEAEQICTQTGKNVSAWMYTDSTTVVAHAKEPKRDTFWWEP